MSEEPLYLCKHFVEWSSLFCLFLGGRTKHKGEKTRKRDVRDMSKGRNPPMSPSSKSSSKGGR